MRRRCARGMRRAEARIMTRVHTSLVACLLLAVLASGCGPREASSAPDIECGGEPLPGIDFGVFDAATGAAICGSRVVATQGADFAEELVVLSSANSCRFQGLLERPGTYSIWVTAPGYRGQLIPDVTIEAGPCHVLTRTIDAALVAEGERSECPIADSDGFTESDASVTGGGDAVVASDAIVEDGDVAHATQLLFTQECDLTREPIMHFSWAPSGQAAEQRVLVTAYADGFAHGLFSASPSLDGTAATVTAQRLDWVGLLLQWQVVERREDGTWISSGLTEADVVVCPQDLCN